MNRLDSNQRKFVAEIIGTFIVVLFATDPVVIDAKMNGVLGVLFFAFAPFVGRCYSCLSLWEDIYGAL